VVAGSCSSRLIRCKTRSQENGKRRRRGSRIRLSETGLEVNGVGEIRDFQARTESLDQKIAVLEVQLTGVVGRNIPNGVGCNDLSRSDVSPFSVRDMSLVEQGGSTDKQLSGAISPMSLELSAFTRVL